MIEQVEQLTRERDEARQQRDDYRRMLIERTGRDPSPRAASATTAGPTGCGCRRTAAGECIWEALYGAASQSHQAFLEAVRATVKGEGA